ncbi:hypothetical protein R3P38DRAFT_2822352 [Favolaschia claudopus]|uniref:DUF6593 domain-containing protein n=1 Tax=Favolaschia claudopus TaxID=2862362 RepID=A0AAW0EH45_9AGAR
MILPSPSDSSPRSGIPVDFDLKTFPSDQNNGEGENKMSPISPARYRSPRRPAGPVTYLFTPLPSNSMLLAPSDVTDRPQRPYIVSVNLNCFTPTSYITQIKKTAWDGDHVGDFELSSVNVRNSGTVCLRGNEYLISDVLSSQFNVFRTTWEWKIKNGTDKPILLFWDDYAGGGVLTCYSSHDKNPDSLLARFTPRTSLRKYGQPHDPPKLMVSPEGHDFFDDILMSALIIERIRTTPSSS